MSSPKPLAPKSGFVSKFLQVFDRMQCSMKRLRLHPLPLVGTLFLIGFNTIYILFYILPELIDTKGLLYKTHCLLSIFLLHNLFGNLFYCWRTDVGIGALPKERQHPQPAEAHLWKHCTYCQMLVPPRAYHCHLCNGCTLKRVHHCHIIGKCVGHANHRYYIALSLYLALGLLVDVVYSFLYMYDNLLSAMPKMSKWMIFNHILIKINLLFLILATGFFVTQLLRICGRDCAIQDRIYDLGTRRNLHQVMGKRIVWTWLSPFIHSPLPQDGTQWRTNATPNRWINEPDSKSAQILTPKTNRQILNSRFVYV